MPRSKLKWLCIIIISTSGLFILRNFNLLSRSSRNIHSIPFKQKAVLKNLTGINIFPIYGHKNEKFPIGKIPSITGKSITVFTYLPREDRWVSAFILSGKGWENNIIQPLQKYMKRNVDLHFIDIGTNLGIYALSVAALGRQVIAVDANSRNLIRTAQSVRANGFSDRITLVHNAIYNKHRILYLKKVMRNIGGQPVEESGSKDNSVAAITADDLLQIISFKRAVMKVDIEGKEAHMFLKSDELFKKIDIPMILMEWAHKHQHYPEETKHLIKFMTRRGYRAFATIDSPKPLVDDNTKWPLDVVFKRSN